MNTPLESSFMPRQIILPSEAMGCQDKNISDGVSAHKALSSQRKASARQRKTVTFCCNVKLRNYASGYNDDNEIGAKSSIWYSREELKSIREEVNLTLDLISTLGPDHIDDEEYCRRGIEYRHPEQSARRSQRKKIVRDAVLTEQEHQMEESGIVDEYKLAMIYREYSYGYQVAAEKRGELDAQEVRQELLLQQQQQQHSSTNASTTVMGSRWVEPGSLSLPIRYPFRKRTVGKYKLAV